MKNKIKVCLIADQHSLYDDRIYWKEAMSLIKKGYEVYYICIGNDEGTGKTKEEIYYHLIKRKKYLSTTIFNYLFKKIPFIKTEYHNALDICKKINPSIIHIHDFKVNKIIKDLKKINIQCKFIYDVHEPLDKNLKDCRFKKSKIPKFITNYYADYIQRWEYKKASLHNYILTTDDGLYERFSSNLPHVDIEIIYNFTNLNKERKILSYEDKIFDAAYIGGLTKIRGTLTAVKATKYIVEKIPSYKLLLLGEIFDKDLKNEITSFIKTNNLENNIILKNFIPYKEISNYYNQIKIGLNPLFNVKAHEEIIQIKLFEYMNFGLPIITSNFGYMKQYVEENNVGICIEPNDEKLLAETIIYLLENRDLFDFYAENGIKAVDERYNWKIMENKLFSIYEKLLNEK